MTSWWCDTWKAKTNYCSLLESSPYANFNHCLITVDSQLFNAVTKALSLTYIVVYPEQLSCKKKLKFEKSVRQFFIFLFFHFTTYRCRLIFHNLIVISFHVYFFYRFCPSVLIYLTMTVPAIWFLELHELEKRIDHRQSTSFNLSNMSLIEIHNETFDLSAHLGSVLGVSFICLSGPFCTFKTRGVRDKE